MKYEMSEVTGAEIKAYSEKLVSDKMLDDACKEKYFREFIRICIAMTINTSYSKKPSTFGHCFTVLDAEKKRVTLDLDVKIRLSAGNPSL